MKNYYLKRTLFSVVFGHAYPSASATSSWAKILFEAIWGRNFILCLTFCWKLRGSFSKIISIWVSKGTHAQPPFWSVSCSPRSTKASSIDTSKLVTRSIDESTLRLTLTCCSLIKMSETHKITRIPTLTFFLCQRDLQEFVGPVFVDIRVIDHLWEDARIPNMI